MLLTILATILVVGLTEEPTTSQADKATAPATELVPPPATRPGRATGCI